MNDGPPIFVADAPGLDFINSLATPTDQPVEWLDSGDGLLRWLDAAGLVDHAVIEDFQRTALPAELDAVAAQARALRGWFRDFVLRHSGVPLDAMALADLDPINRILARDEQHLVISEPTDAAADAQGSAPLVLERHRRWKSPEALLLPLAEAMAQVVCEEDFRHVRGCEGHNCTLVFVDRTRRRARRWCSMAVCGNRAKQAAHRDRANAGRH